MSKSASIQTLFFRGNNRELLRKSLGAARFDVSKDDLPFVIGSLCFDGRKEEGEKIFEKIHAKLDPAAAVSCRFFLGVAFCRHGHYEKSRRYFALNLKEMRRRPEKDDLISYYSLQGYGFYKYFCGKFDVAQQIAEDALSIATLIGFSYGRTLSLDLIGHSFVQQGGIAAGLDRLENARKIAAELGNGGLASSIQISGLVYRAQYGLSPKTIIKELRAAYLKLDPQNSYARSNLLLELGNQFLLRGQAGEAVKALNDASSLIYGSQHRRYAHLLTLRFAEVSYRSGQFASALHSVQTLRPLLDERHDRVNLLMTVGMELKLLRALGMDAKTPPLQAVLDRLTQATPRAIAKNIFERAPGFVQEVGREDRIAQVLSEMTSLRARALPSILRSGYYALIPEVLKIPKGSSCVVVSADPSYCFVVDQGDVLLNRNTIPSQLSSLLRNLKRTKTSKEELIRKVWGYTYHPIPHDPLIYQAISRLREFLGKKGHWIEAVEDGYRLQKGVQVFVLDESEEKIPEVHFVPVISDPKKDLNHRQIKILALLDQQEFVRVRDCVKKFAVSDMTLKRDFSILLDAGYVIRVGQARASRYKLRRAHEDETVSS